MNPERWQAVGGLFEQALALPPGERTLCIERVSAGDDELRSEVLSLLASHKALPGGFVQERIKNAVVSFYQTNLAGPQPALIGPYRVIRELGRGGMGTVFLAERHDDQNGTRVAIKLVRPGMDTEFILARFRRERQTLARMQHPNIARLLDGGTTSEGLPYIVMEYIDGLRITEHAQQQKLGINARIVLFLSVCSAVDYAHRNFVIHRDIKPGNILVDSQDSPKLLDFGICKLLANPLSDISSAETVNGVLMTPNYASPEQIRGKAVTLLSDVYSLGVVLYELLTEKRFAQLNGQGLSRSVVDVTVPPPSAVVEDRALKRQLFGDLDNILMHALETEPQRRYESVALFADDLRRHLLDEPIRAQPQTLRYRTIKFLRRNRGKVTAAAAVFIALAGSLAVSLREIHLVGVRQAQMAADITEANSGPLQDALDHIRDSTAEMEELMASHPQKASVSTQLYRALVSQQLGDLLNKRGDSAGANKAYLESASIAESNLKSGENPFLGVFIGSNRKLALNAIAQGHRDAALDFGRRALEASAEAPPGVAVRFASPRALSAMGLIYAELLRSPLHQASDREQAISWLRKGVDGWHQVQTDPEFGALQQREMRATEEALAAVQNR
jgi:serine/threonine protein kinase